VAANVASGEVKFSSSKRRVAAAAVVILLVLFLVRPGVSRLKSRIINSISRAVARPADIGSVHLRFLPQPGFDLENLVIYEDAAFGAEPMLRAPEVMAVVRLSSLVRGRLDISRLELTEPSLNLVRREDGRWNWESLLERTARTPLAPTAKSKSEARPGFPYIEASSGRINFKAGAEKKPYALLNADFALWQESENAWGVRLKAEPLRTDVSLSDTGLLRMNGTWQRAGSLRETPLQFSVEWDRAQLGQLTKLATGNDKGWRGDVRLEATLSGMPEAMQVTADAAIQNFHRYDISTSEGLGLMSHCDGKYSSGEGMMREIFCSGPVGSGMITLHGEAGRPGTHRLDLALNVENIPVSSVAQLARRAKKSLPADLMGTGSVQGNFTVKEDGASTLGPEFRGRGEVTNLRVRSASTKAELALESLPFVLSSGRDDAEVLSTRKFGRKLDAEVLPVPDELHISYGPFPVALGRPVPAQARGWVGRSGYAMVVRGDGEVSHTLRMAGLLGLQAMKASVEGEAQMDLQIAGVWAGSGAETTFVLPRVTGTVQLREVRAALKGVDGPVEISSAELHLLPEEVRAEKLKALAGDAHWTGSVAMPRGCGTPGACVIHFNLNSDEVGLSEMSKWVGSHPSQRRWYQVLGRAEPGAPSFLENLRAAGTVSAGRVLVHDVVANRVSAAIELDSGKMKISDLRADLLGGKHQGDWTVDFAAASPVYAGSGTLSGISLEKLAGAMHDAWISGTARGSYQVTASGGSSAAFWQTAEGRLQFEVRDGGLSHISLSGDEGGLQIGRWRGTGHLHSGKMEIEKSEIDSAGEMYEVSGSASLGRVLDLRVIGAQGKPVYRITGTLAEPRVVVSATPETQARLKP
jgi:AsmA family/AsmA-like C-terminal region